MQPIAELLYLEISSSSFLHNVGLHFWRVSDIKCEAWLELIILLFYRMPPE